MWAIAKENVQDFSINFEFLQAPAEEIPLDSTSVDTIVVTYTLCTIPDVLPALQDMRRVLKPGGELIFCEHGEAPDEKVQRWQGRLNPIWKKLGGGCNLNRKIPLLLVEAGFKIQGLDTMYIPGWKPASFNYWGLAT